MSDLTIKTWVAQEASSFDHFNAMLASRFEEAWGRSLIKKLRDDLRTKDEAEVVLPWGTYRATLKTVGEGTNIAPSWEPSKGFLKLLNGDLDASKRSEAITQEDFDPEFEKLFCEYVAYGFFGANDPENKDRAAKNKAVRLKHDESVYFLNGYAMVLATIGKDKQRDGKIFRLEINNGFPHGFFDFEYDDDEIKVKWTADKVFKQLLKDDDAASRADNNDFTPIRETRIEKIPVA